MIELEHLIHNHYGQVSILDSEEGKNRLYLRFMTDSTIYVAVMIKGSKNASFYRLEGSTEE